MRFLAVASVTVSLALGGCVAHEPVGVPLSPGEVERINGVARENHWLRVEYVEPIATKQDAHVDRPSTIASVDDVAIGFRTRAGDVDTVPTAMVKGLTVKERAPGVSAGVGIGLGAGALVLGLAALASASLSRGGWPDSDPNRPSSPPSDADTAKTAIFFLVTPAIVGGIVGYFVGGRRTFDLEHVVARELR
jgi:hypothetical protein